jgi:glycerophosphoryl diester phosphodiesterase
LIHLVAHRGDARDFPENTIPAFTSALELGLRFLELDVHMSADGVPMVIHDHELTRTTGRPGCVFDMRARELVQIDACEPTRFGERFRGTRIPTADRGAGAAGAAAPRSRCSSRSSAPASPASATTRWWRAWSTRSSPRAASAW